MPATRVPEVDVPFADKWTHFVMFGGFTFLWLCAKPEMKGKQIITLLLIAIVFGVFIEYMQLLLTFLKRSGEVLDGIADALGAVLGVALFYILRQLAN